MKVEELINDSSIEKINSSMNLIGKIQSSLVDLFNGNDPNDRRTPENKKIACRRRHFEVFDKGI